jgi:hypothetical protein
MLVRGIVGRIQLIRPMMAGTAAVVAVVMGMAMDTEAIAGMMVTRTIVD